MKFARDLNTTEARAPEVFKGSYLKYSGLKKFLKFRNKQLSLVPADTADYREALRRSDAEFLRLLAGQLREIDRRFELEARSVIAAFDRKKSKRKSFWVHRDPKESAMDPQFARNLARRAQACLRYAQINAQALRKVAKKHDKLFGNRIGQQFVQVCFSRSATNVPATQHFNYFGSKLGASQALLRFKAAADQSSVEATTSSGETKETDSEIDAADFFKCAICLDVMYQPVALECGHRFCARCVIATAVGHEGSKGSVEHLLASGPVGCSEVPCPQCRAAEHGSSGHGVFFNARRLPHVDQLIQSRQVKVASSSLAVLGAADELASRSDYRGGLRRFPQDWERRREEDELEQRELKAARAPRGLFHFLHLNSLHSDNTSASPSG